MFLGDPPVLKEHLYIQDQKMHTCLKMALKYQNVLLNARYQLCKKSKSSSSS